MNIVLINLTRFGDQLQSQAAINALANQNGEKNRICLITLSNFASSSVFLDNISLTYPLPRDAFMESLSSDWPSVAGRLWAWKRELVEKFPPDLICNITPSVSARLLGRFLAGDTPYTGYGMDEFGFGTASPWAAFFQGSSQRREVSPFNLVDLFRAVAGVSQGPPAEAGPEKNDFRLLAPGADSPAARSVSAMLEGAARVKGLVAFQLGASEERRRWPVEHFAALGQALWSELGYMPLLLGGKNEEALAERYAQAASAAGGAPHISLIGRTGLEELACALMRSALLVSNDTGTMHLAAGLGRPVLGIFLATAQPWDTGPYLAGSCSVEPGLPCHPCPFGKECPHDEQCRHAIAPAELIRLCLGFLRDGAWPAMADVSQDGRPRLWLAGKDNFGFMNLASLSGHENEARTIWFREQRRFLRQFLDRDPAAPFTYIYPAEKFEMPPGDREKLAAELTGLEARLALLAELGGMLMEKPLPMLRERFISALHKASTAFESAGYLISLGLLWQVEVQEKGDELAAALTCIKQYHSLIRSLLHRVTA